MEKIFKIGFVFSLVLFVLIFSSCSGQRNKEIVGTGELITTSYTYLAGDKITIRDLYVCKNNVNEPAEVYFYEGDDSEKKILITSESNVLTCITPKVKNNIITISGGAKNYFVSQQIKVEIYGYSFKEISLDYIQGEIKGQCVQDECDINLSNQCNVKISDLNIKEIDITCTGASTITGNQNKITEADISCSGASKLNLVDCEISELSLELSGASKATIYGTGEEIDSECSGASTIDARNYFVKKAEIELSGASSMTISVSDELSYELSGASNLIYIGKPNVTEKKTSGGSKATQKDVW